MSEERYCQAEEIELRSIVGEHFLIVLHAGESKMFNLNGMGLWFWRQLEQPVTKSELLKAMLSAYDASEDVAAGEIDRFLAHLVEKELARRLVADGDAGE